MKAKNDENINNIQPHRAAMATIFLVWIHYLSTDLFDVPGRPTVVLPDHPFGPLVEVEPVEGHHVTELFGQRLGALQTSLL